MTGVTSRCRPSSVAAAGASLCLAAAILRGGFDARPASSPDDGFAASAQSDAHMPIETDAVGPRRRFRAQDLTPEFIDRALDVARDVEPDLAIRLEKLRAEDDAGFRQALLRSHRLLVLTDLRLREPSMYELKLIELRADAQVVGLATAYRAALAADSAEVAEIERDLRTALRLQLVFGLAAREDYLCRLQAVVARLESDVQHEKEHFDDLVEARLDACKLEGGPPPIGRPRPGS